MKTNKPRKQKGVRNLVVLGMILAGKAAKSKRPCGTPNKRAYDRKRTNDRSEW